MRMATSGQPWRSNHSSAAAAARPGQQQQQRHRRRPTSSSCQRHAGALSAFLAGRSRRPRRPPATAKQAGQPGVGGAVPQVTSRTPAASGCPRPAPAAGCPEHALDARGASCRAGSRGSRRSRPQCTSTPPRTSRRQQRQGDGTEDAGSQRPAGGVRLVGSARRCSGRTARPAPPPRTAGTSTASSSQRAMPVPRRLLGRLPRRSAAGPPAWTTSPSR